MSRVENSLLDESTSRPPRRRPGSSSGVGSWPRLALPFSVTQVSVARASLLSWLTIGAFLTACGNAERGPAPPPAPVEVGIVTVQPQPVSLTTELPGRTLA